MENSDIGILSLPHKSSSQHDNIDIPSPFAAYSGARQNNGSFSSGSSVSHSKQDLHIKTPSPTTSIGIHRTQDGRRFITNGTSTSSSSRVACDLCFNKHVNPWHSTTDCLL